MESHIPHFIFELRATAATINGTVLCQLLHHPILGSANSKFLLLSIRVVIHVTYCFFRQHIFSIANVYSVCFRGTIRMMRIQQSSGAQHLAGQAIHFVAVATLFKFGRVNYSQSWPLYAIHLIFCCIAWLFRLCYLRLWSFETPDSVPPD